MAKSFYSSGKKKPKTTMSGWNTGSGSSPVYDYGLGIDTTPEGLAAAGVPTQTLQPLPPAAAAPAPPPPYNPYASPLYTGGVANAAHGLNNYYATAGANEGAAAYDLGYTLTRNPYVKDAAGNIIGGGEITGSSLDWNTIDTSNPFSRAALLKRSYQQGQAGSTNSLAARGMLNSGALNRALREGNFKYEQGQDSIGKAIAEIIRGSQSGQRTAQGEYNSTVWNALQAAINNVPSPT